MLKQVSYGLEIQGRKHLLHKGTWKVREFENCCTKSQGNSGEKIPVENEVFRRTFGSQLFSIKRVIGCDFFNVCFSCQL